MKVPLHQMRRYVSITPEVLARKIDTQEPFELSELSLSDMREMRRAISSIYPSAEEILLEFQLPSHETQGSIEYLTRIVDDSISNVQRGEVLDKLIAYTKEPSRESVLKARAGHIAVTFADMKLVPLKVKIQVLNGCFKEFQELSRGFGRTYMAIKYTCEHDYNLHLEKAVGNEEVDSFMQRWIPVIKTLADQGFTQRERELIAHIGERDFQYGCRKQGNYGINWDKMVYAPPSQNKTLDPSTSVNKRLN